MRRLAGVLVCVVLAGCGGSGGGHGRTEPDLAGARVLAEHRVAPRELDLTIRSPALGRDATVRLLEPDRGARPYPVLYLLHGCCDSYQSWTRSTDVERMPGLRRALVVMPEGGTVGFYSDWLRGPGWESFHTLELPALLGRYGAGNDYAVAGLSMGGLGAIDYAARHPKLFRAAASFSGVLHPLGSPDVWLGLFSSYTDDADAVWGDPQDDRDVWREHDPTALLPALAGIRLFVSAGDGRPGPFEDGRGDVDPTEVEVGGETRTFVRRARALGIPVRADLYGAGIHDWPYWQRELHRALPLLLGAIRG